MRKIYLDELTNCYNRRFLHYWVENEIKRANRFSTKFGLILLDLDDFREINNNFGHLEGDKVLAEFTSFLEKNTREVDSLVRFGGDEFIILIPNASKAGTLELAQRILTNLNKAKINNHKILSSVGFSIFPDDGTSLELLISKADNLLYQAKREGKNRIGVKQKIIRKLQIPCPVTIGREEEISFCLGQLKNYDTILIAGESGIGKTRLVYEIKDRFKDVMLLRGNSYAALSSVPYHSFRNMFDELVNKHFALTQRILRKMPKIYQSEVMKLFPAEEKFISSGEGLDKYRLFNAVSEFFRKMSEAVFPKIVILLIDDLHWTDQPSCELLDFLIRSKKGNIKIFGTYRIEEFKNSNFAKFLGIWSRETLYSQLRLQALNEKESAQIVKTIMGNAPLHLKKFIFNQSGGNPFFIEEIIRALEHDKKLYWDGQNWSFLSGLEFAIPTSIEETIKRKLNFLLPETRKYLELTAVFGKEFKPEIIAQASKTNVGEVLDALDELCRVGFIKERTPEIFFFGEDIVRQVAYKNISRANLRQYHHSIGKAIEVLYKTSLANYFEELAVHFTKANDAEKALYYSKKAALKARETYAHDIAIKFFKNALEYEDNIEEIFKIKFSLADIYFLIGDYKKTIELLNVCLKLNPNFYKIYSKLGDVYEDMGKYKDSLKCYRRGLKLTQGTDALYIFRSNIAWVYTRLGQYLRAKKECEEILKKKKKVGRQEISDTFIILGVVFLRLGKFNKAIGYFKKGLKIRETVGDKKRIAACYVDLATCYVDLAISCGRKFNFTRCENFYKKALQIYEEIGYQEGIAVTLLDLGAFYHRYNLPKAEEYYLKALQISKLIGAKRDMVYLYNNLGSLNYDRIMNDQALTNYKRALELAKETHFDEGILTADFNLSEFYRERGQIKKGKSYLKSAQNIVKGLNLKYCNLDCLMEELDYLLPKRNLKKADMISRKLLSQTRSEDFIFYKVYGLIYRAKTLVAQKKYSRGHQYYNRAYNFVKSLPSNGITGEIYYLKAVAYKKNKKLKDAQTMSLKAKKIFEEIGNLRYLDKLGSGL